MDRHHEMTVFDAVAQDLSLAAAARRLAISVPTVTRAMASLEARLGVCLLERTTRGVSLTEAGRAFASDCRRILQDVEQAQASANGLHTEPRGQLRLVMPLLFGQQLLMPILLDYLDAFPAIEAFTRYEDRFPNLHEEGVDVAVSVGEPPDASMVALKVGSVRHCICASPGYLARHGEPGTPEDIVHHQIVHSSADSRLPQWRFLGQGEPYTVSFRPRLRCASNPSAISAAILGAGLTRCMSYQIHDEVARGRLCRLLMAYEPPALAVHLVYREGRKASARVRSFVDFAVARLRAHPALNRA